MVAFACDSVIAGSGLSDPMIRMVAFGLASSALADASDPVITMAAFGSGGLAPGGSARDDFMCRETVSRSTLAISTRSEAGRAIGTGAENESTPVVLDWMPIL